MRIGRRAVLVASAFAAMLPAAAPAAPPAPAPYRDGDPGGFRNILPPGSNGRANLAEIGAFLATGARPVNNDDQLPPYEDLVHAVPGLQPADLDRFFKDASIGAKPEDVVRTYGPRDDVTIQRDRWGVPHITATTRAGAMFAIGYVTAEDRLFFIDVLRHVGRGQLASFAGGAESNRALDRDIWQSSPYTEAELERQVDVEVALRVNARHPEIGVTPGEVRALVDDVQHYTLGINAYISEARMDPSKMPGEYAAIGRPAGPDDWKASDAVAIATLVGGLFGKGGGSELASAVVRQGFHVRFGRTRGERLWRGFRAARDPEHVATVRRRFTGPRVPKRPTGLAIPDRGSLVYADVRDAPGGVPRSGAGRAGASGLLTAGRAASGAVAAGVGAAVRVWREAARRALLPSFPSSASNALVVSAAEAEGGRPLAVFGPQTAYFAPQILMEHSVVAPGLRARGVAFPGTNIYVQLGRGQDYAWSATSAGNDVIDTLAVELCDRGGAPVGYRLRGACEPFEVLERENSWEPSLADSTPAGTERLVTHRTRYGPVIARGKVRGKPVAYVQARTTYFHESESIVGFQRINDPTFTRSPQDFQRAFYGVQFTFNWFYADHRHIAYFNSGGLPVRAPRVHPDFPVLVGPSTEPRGFDPELRDFAIQPFSVHPRSVDQPFFANWNNKQARDYRADDGRYNYSSVDRGELLHDRLDLLTKGPAKASLVEVVEAMEDAGTVDLRGRYLLPYALRVIGRPADVRASAAVARLRAWLADGAHRRDRDDDGRYEHSDAIRIMDAWWPLWVRAQLTPVLGNSLARRVIDHVGLGDMPNLHQGSAFDDGVWGQIEKDLRAVLGRRVRGRLARKLCGGGVLRRCRADLTESLIEAAAVKDTDIYRDPDCADGDQRCFDEIRHRPLGAVTQPPIHWVNRPTFQQVVEVAGPRP